MAVNNKRKWIKALVTVKCVTKSGAKVEKTYRVFEQSDMFQVKKLITVPEDAENYLEEMYKEKIKLFSQSILLLMTNEGYKLAWNRFQVEDIVFETVEIDDNDTDIQNEPYDRRDIDRVADKGRD